MATQTRTATSITTNAGIGYVDWTNPANAATADGLYAEATSYQPAADSTYYLWATGFGFSLPHGSVVTDITVTIGRHMALTGPDPWGDAQDFSLQLIWMGVAGGDDQADQLTSWPTVNTDRSYSGLWGCDNFGWTPQDIVDAINDSPNFGVAFSAQLYGNALPNYCTVYVDHLTMAVTYTPPAGAFCPHGCLC